MVRILLFSSLLLLAAPTAPAAQDTLRCGSKIISRGMSTAEVMRYCGQPTEKTVEERPVRSGNRVLGSYEAQIWYYKRGARQKPATLTFEDGVLKSIVFGD